MNWFPLWCVLADVVFNTSRESRNRLYILVVLQLRDEKKHPWSSTTACFLHVLMCADVRYQFVVFGASARVRVWEKAAGTSSVTAMHACLRTPTITSTGGVLLVWTVQSEQ
jgi:hypothetical protein